MERKEGGGEEGGKEKMTSKVSYLIERNFIIYR